MGIVRLLNDGGYGDMDEVSFPVEVDGSIDDLGNCFVTGRELRRVGGVLFDSYFSYCFNSHEFEKIDEQ